MSQSTRSLHESLSAAVDGEAQELELRRVLNAVREDVELGGKWERLHLIRSVIRGEGPGRAADAKRPWLHDAASPGAVHGAPPQRGMRWLGPLTGAAAAAAALMAVVYFGATGSEPASPTPASALADAAPARGLAQVPSERDLRRANSYLLQHAQHTAVGARPVAMPFAKVLSTEEDRSAIAASNER